MKIGVLILFSLIVTPVFMHAQIAQSVEQKIENLRVGGSIPSLGTIIKELSLKKAFCLICA